MRRYPAALSAAVWGRHMLRLKGWPWIRTTGMPSAGPRSSKWIVAPFEMMRLMRAL
ncbi:hypothetical protein ACFQ0Q_43525 [Streptomyces aureus]